jgi:glyoxalase superfamily protein
MIVDTDPKSMASRLRVRLAANGTEITQSQALEIVAAQLGYRDWNTCVAAPRSAKAPITIPILRTFPGEEARRFYISFLGFTVDWEHRFGDGMPLYQQVTRQGCVLHLSEHHGDATPGSAVRIEVPDVRRLQRELAKSPVYPLRIGLDSEPWGEDLTVPDPFGNRINFHTPRQTTDEATRHA